MTAVGIASVVGAWLIGAMVATAWVLATEGPGARSRE